MPLQRRFRHRQTGVQPISRSPSQHSPTLACSYTAGSSPCLPF